MVHWGLDEDLNNGDLTGKYIHIIHTHGVFTQPLGNPPLGDPISRGICFVGGPWANPRWDWSNVFLTKQYETYMVYIYICMYAFYEYNWECTQEWRRFHSDVAWASDVDIGLSRLGWALGNEWNLVILITLNEWNCDNGDFVIMGNTVVSTGKLVILITTTSPIDNNNQLDDTGDFVTWWF